MSYESADGGQPILPPTEEYQAKSDTCDFVTIQPHASPHTTGGQPWSDQEKKDLRTYYDWGCTRRLIAKLMSPRSLFMINDAIRRFGFPLRGHQGRNPLVRPTPGSSRLLKIPARYWSIWEKDRLMARLAESDCPSYAKLALEFGCTKNAIAGIVDRIKMGGPPPHQPAWSRISFPDPGGCLYPYGDPGESGFHFCGAAAAFDRPYCEKHVKICYIRFPVDEATRCLT
jgi:hypothetical protein